MEDKKLASGYKINKILLVESNFFRTNNVLFGDNINNNFEVNIEVAVNGKIITVGETIFVSQVVKDEKQVDIKTRMIGEFECIGETQLTDFENFGRVNGAAIIYPYIREHITNLSLKAGLNAIILPPVNFTRNKKE